MRLHFRNRMFNYTSILRFIAFLLFYLMLTILPYISGYHFTSLYRINFHELISFFHESIFLLVIFITCTYFLFVNIVYACLNYIVLRQIETDFNSSALLKKLIKIKYELDTLNPFLYSLKTKGLLE